MYGSSDSVIACEDGVLGIRNRGWHSLKLVLRRMMGWGGN